MFLKDVPTLKVRALSLSFAVEVNTHGLSPFAFSLLGSEVEVSSISFRVSSSFLAKAEAMGEMSSVSL